MKHQELDIDLKGLEAGQPQAWRAIRIVPLLRDNPIVDLRLDQRCYDNELAWIQLPDRTAYTSWIPHAFVAQWTPDDKPVPALGTQMATKPKHVDHIFFREDKKVARREAKRQMRFLPLHTSLEGYLALHFSGPPEWNFDYTRDARRYGLSPRSEVAFPAHWLPGLEDAVRRFEIQDGQVGALYFVADALAAAFVVPHPDDYRQLHRSVLLDFFGELLHQYGCAYHSLGEVIGELDHDRIHSLEDVASELERVRQDWRELLKLMASGLSTRTSHAQRVYKMGRHTLYRFLPEFKPGAENHIGEVILAQGGETAFLKTLRLSEAQTKRGYLLSSLANADWDLDRCAAEFGQSVTQLITRLYNAGFEDLVEPHAKR